MRCFVALWPDAAARAQLSALTARLRQQWPSARPMQPFNLHLTLAFIGELEHSTARRVAACVGAAGASTPPGVCPGLQPLDGAAARAQRPDAPVSALSASSSQTGQAAVVPDGAWPWSIDRLGSFAAARVLWAGGAPDARLVQLATQARRQLDALGVTYDRQPFVPHVTLLRNVPRAPPPALPPVEPPILWLVTQPHLVQSVSTERGVRYINLGAHLG